MKGSLDRTKVVLRHLPPTISQASITEQVDSRFAGRYNWDCFRPGSQKHLSYSRAYINFNRPDDVIEFAEFFDGHVFVNEKGTQFKAIVEYAPSQRVPKQWSKKDGREGTIVKDPEYMEFLELLAKPVENLPSAEIQLERKEAERAGAAKDAPVVTPLMEYIRQKRAAKNGARRPVSNGKSTRRVVGPSSGSPSTNLSKRGSERRRTSTMYVLRDSTKGTNNKEKSTYAMVSKRDDQQNLPGKSAILAASSSMDETVRSGSGSGPAETGKKRILLLKGKEKEIPNDDGMSLQQNVRNSPSSNVYKQNQRRETSGKVIKSILVNKDSRHNNNQSSSSTPQSIQIDKDRRPPRNPPSIQTFQKDHTNGPLDNNNNNNNESQFDKRNNTRNRDRPDRGVWAPLRRSDGSHASNDSLSSSSSQPNQVFDSLEGNNGDIRSDMTSGQFRRNNDNGSYKHGGRRGSAHNNNNKDTEGVEGKSSKRGVSTGYGSHEKQVWIQKSSVGS